MQKTISVRGRKDLVALFRRYHMLSAEQNVSRPKAVAAFLGYLSTLPKNADTAQLLRRAAKRRLREENQIRDEDVPSAMKITFELSDEAWQNALDVVSYAFGVTRVQMPFLLRVSGNAFLNSLENRECAREGDNISLERFQSLSLDDKLTALYKLLLQKSY